MRIVLACLVAAALMALAATGAFAQDAGSQQYQDPLAGDPGSNPSTPGGGGGGGSGNAAPSNPGTETAQANGQESAAGSDGLPRTGLDAWVLVIAGAALLGGGFALRRVTDPAGA